MNITTERTADCQLKLKVEVDQARVDEHLRRAARRLSRQVLIPGFRPGKAPYEVVLRRVGKEALYEEALEELSQEIYREVLEDQKITPYAEARLTEVSLEPLVLEYTVPLMPEVDLGDYRAIRVEPRPVQITEADVDRALEELRREKGDWNPVDRSIVEGDWVELQITARMEGQPLYAVNHKLVVDASSSAIAPGFAAHLLGMKTGEQKTFDITYPEDWADETVAGKTVTFDVTVNSVKEQILPELNDEFAAMVGDYTSLAELRLRVREDLLREAEHEERHRFENEALDKLIAGAQISYPPVLVEQEIEELLREQDSRLRREEGLPLDDYLKVTGQEKERLVEFLRPLAETRVKQALVLSELVRAENLQVTDEDLQSREQSVVEAFPEDSAAIRNMLKTPQGRAVMRRDILTHKALERLVAIARGEAPELVPESNIQPVAEVSTQSGEAETPVAAGTEETS